MNFADPFGLCPDPKDPTCKYPDDQPIQKVTADVTIAKAILDYVSPEVGAAAEVISHISDIKAALTQVHDFVGKLSKGAPGKFGSPQRGDSKKGYRLDPGHPDREVGSPEAGLHINWWDYTSGKRNSGGMSGAVPIAPSPPPSPIVLPIPE